MAETDTLQGPLDVLQLEEGSLYPDLHCAKWIEKSNSRRVRSHDLTVRGRKQLVNEETRWPAATGAVQSVLKLA